MKNNDSQIFQFWAFGLILFYFQYFISEPIFPVILCTMFLCKYCLRVVSLSPLHGIDVSLIIFEIGYESMILWMFEYFSMAEGHKI